MRIIVTGGNGFLGKYVCNELKNAEVIVPRSSEFDLRKKEDIDKLLEVNPQVIIHLAATVGGIEANRRNPGRFFYDNAIMGIQLMEQARLKGVEKFVLVGTVCSYPNNTPSPFKEEDIWNGYPEVTNAPYGLAKKMLMVQAQAYRQQYNFNAITLLPANLYGPGDNFDSTTSHVIPALIKKTLKAKYDNKSLEVWGTGKPSREFLHARDAARGIVLATEHYNEPEPVNLGTGQETSIKELVEVICDLCEFKGNILWNTEFPDGQPRRCLDVERAKKFGFEAKINIIDGLKETIEWYKNEIN